MKNSKYYPWMVVGLLWVVALLNYMDRQMLATMRPSMEADIPELVSGENFGRLMAIFLWIYALMSPVSGLIADKLNRKWLIVGSLFVWSAVTYAMGYATGYNEVYWLRALMGVSEALYIPAGLSLIADYHQQKSRSLAIGIHMTGLYVGSALGGFGATIAAAYSWHTTFHYFGLIGVVYALVLVFFLYEKKAPEKKMVVTDLDKVKEKSSVFKGLGLLFTNISFWIILFFFATISLPGWATKNWLPTLFSDNLGISMEQAGPLATITISMSSLLGVIFGGILSDKWVVKNIKGRVYTSAIGLSLTIPALLLIGFGNSLFHIVSAALCFGIGYGMFDANNMPILCQFVSSKQRATAYGILNMTGVGCGALVTSILGKYADEGTLGSGFAMMAGVVLAALLVQIIFLRPQVNDYIDV
ncbi:sugar phosphate permease [Flavobacterium sp. 103]|uniref:MFS transporter n=1 Tax=Flavobacterium sp. 103 TaxID=2135624 RepID=UPI000D5F04C5|nr:MFS transporter [Flavobacterium sp. 103]PVX44520.1 sugar phosphate permease [Flavobacterium sp. 103]